MAAAGNGPRAGWPFLSKSMWSGLAAVLLVQLAYWLLVQPALFAKPQQPELLEIINPQYARLNRADEGALNAAKFEPVELPHDGCCAPGYGALRAEFELASVPKEGLVMLSPRGVDNTHIRLNGQWVNQPGRLELPRITYHGTLRSLIHLPAATLRPGLNRYESIMVRSATPYMDVWPPQIGPVAAMTEANARILFVANEYRILSCAVAAIVALLSLMLFLRSDSRALPFWGFVLASAWGLRTFYYFWVDPPFSGEGRLAFYFAVTGAIPMAWANVANEWTESPWKLVRWVATGAGLAMIAWMVWALLSGQPGAYDLASKITDLGGLALGGLACVVLAWHLVRRRDERHWEIAVMVLAITLLSSDYLKQFTEAKSNVFMANTVPLLLIGFAIAFFARNIRLFRSMGAINQLLQGQLREREAELAAEYARQEELARRETLVSERQRLMRDMHDGIGGQLMSLLFAARQKTIPRAELTEGLQAVIDELRLIIDSLDTVGESLGAALASFRGRIEPRLAAAGIRIEWTNRLPDDLPGLSPRAILQVFRIVQEAITNAIKHSGSKAIAIELELAPDDPSRLLVRVADQGKGISKGEANLAGRGIESMRARATAIGGKLDLASDTAGTTVTLRVPLEPASA